MHSTDSDPSPWPRVRLSDWERDPLTRPDPVYCVPSPDGGTLVILKDSAGCPIGRRAARRYALLTGERVYVRDGHPCGRELGWIGSWLDREGPQLP